MNIENLVFEGGGVKGMAYVGAYQILEEKKLLSNLKRCAGASAGAIIATLIAADFTSKELDKIMRTSNFNEFLDDSWFPPTNIWRLFKKFGWHKGKAFENWFKEVLKQKGQQDATFATFQGKELYLIGTDVGAQKIIVFSKEVTPNMKIVEAVRASMAIPLVFTGVKKGKTLLVDGGVYSNYPLNLFDKKTKNKKTLGFRVDSKNEIMLYREKIPKIPTQVTNLKTYAQVLIGGLIDAANSSHLSGDDWNRTVFIDSLGIGATQFSLSKEQQQALVDSGKQGMQRYLDWKRRAK